jgi:hypothetical protein
MLYGLIPDSAVGMFAFLCRSGVLILAVLVKFLDNDDLRLNEMA